MAKWYYLLLAYPVIVHFAVIYDQATLAVSAAGGFIAITVAGTFRNRRAALFAAVCLALLVANIGWGWTRTFPVVYLPPILISASLFFLFGSTLLPGRIPLITRFAAIQHGALDDKVVRYTTRLTRLWTIVFLFLMAETVLLALFAPMFVWSLVTNFLNYIAVALVFVLEYRIRMHVLDHIHHPGIFKFIHALARFEPGRSGTDR